MQEIALNYLGKDGRLHREYYSNPPLAITVNYYINNSPEDFETLPAVFSQ